MIQIYQKIKIVESICRSDLNLDKKDQYIYIWKKYKRYSTHISRRNIDCTPTKTKN
jgi:hypothetical protein